MRRKLPPRRHLRSIRVLPSIVSAASYQVTIQDLTGRERVCEGLRLAAPRVTLRWPSRRAVIAARSLLLGSCARRETRYLHREDVISRHDLPSMTSKVRSLARCIAAPQPIDFSIEQSDRVCARPDRSQLVTKTDPLVHRHRGLSAEQTADLLDQCPLSGVIRKTFAPTEFF